MGEISLLNELELKFIELDLKISSRCSLVNQLHDDDVQKIDQIFGKSNEDKITNELNDHRSSLLNKIKENLPKQLELMDDVVNYSFKKTFCDQTNNKSSLNRKLNLTKSMLNATIKDIKDNLLVLNQSNSYVISNLISILFKFDFTMPLDLDKLNKYYNFIVFKKREFELIIDDTYLPLDCHSSKKFISLSPYRLLVMKKTKAYDKMNTLMVLGNRGQIFHSKVIYRKAKEQFKASSKFIFYIYSEEKKLNTNIEIYTFELVLIKTLILNELFDFDLILSNDEFALHESLNKLNIYNTNTFNAVSINFSKHKIADFYSENSGKMLIHFDDKKLFYIKSQKLNKRDKRIIIIDRSKLNIINDFNLFDRLDINLSFFNVYQSVKFDKNSKIYFFSRLDKSISVFDSNGVKLQDVKINFYHKSIYFTFNNTIQFFDDSFYHFRFSRSKYDEY